MHAYLVFKMNVKVLILPLSFLYFFSVPFFFSLLLSLSVSQSLSSWWCLPFGGGGVCEGVPCGRHDFMASLVAADGESRGSDEAGGEGDGGAGQLQSSAGDRL